MADEGETVYGFATQEDAERVARATAAYERTPGGAPAGPAAPWAYPGETAHVRVTSTTPSLTENGEDIYPCIVQDYAPDEGWADFAEGDAWFLPANGETPTNDTRYFARAAGVHTDGEPIYASEAATGGGSPDVGGYDPDRVTYNFVSAVSTIYFGDPAVAADATFSVVGGAGAVIVRLEPATYTLAGGVSLADQFIGGSGSKKSFQNVVIQNSGSPPGTATTTDVMLNSNASQHLIVGQRSSASTTHHVLAKGFELLDNATLFGGAASASSWRMTTSLGVAGRPLFFTSFASVSGGNAVLGAFQRNGYDGSAFPFNNSTQATTCWFQTPGHGYFGQGISVGTGAGDTAKIDGVGALTGGDTMPDGTEFRGGACTAKGGLFQAAPTVTGSRGGNAALQSLLTALATLGLIVDSTT